MQFVFTEEQRALRRQARSFLEQHASTEHVRRAMQTELGYDAQLWKRIASELGWPALIVPERLGGAGLGYVELVALLEETGRSLLCAPLFSTLCLFASAVLELGSQEQQERLLAGIAAGETTGTLAYAERSGTWDASGIAATARRRSGGFELTGQKCYVVDGHSADHVLVAARAPGSSGEHGISLFLVDAQTPGVQRRPSPALDSTRKLAEITLAGAVVPESALLGAEGDGWRCLAHLGDLACVALSAEQVGGAERCLEMAADYSKLRVQFGRPIGSFQAIKHKLAEMFVRVESARSACYYAAWVAADSGAELPAAAAQAKAYASEAFLFAAAENIQIHGGTGFTWEHDAHLYFKRAKAAELMFGEPAYHRERYAAALGL